MRAFKNGGKSLTQRNGPVPAESLPLSSSPPKPLFLDGQRLSLLKEIADPALLKKIVCEGYQPAEEELGDSDAELWSDYARAELVKQAAGNEPMKRVALLCDAGLGKTTNTDWLAATFGNVKNSWQVPLYLRMDDAEAKNELLKEFREPNSLLDWLSILVKTAADGLQERCRQALKRFQASGRITVIIDGLDHVIAEEGFVQKLKRFLTSVQWRNCPVWLSGRPYAIRDGWKHLFATGDWRFIHVEPLPESEIRRSMEHSTGGDWYDVFPHETRWMLATPRLLGLICGIIRTGIATGQGKGQNAEAAVRALGLNTPADVYHRAYFEKGEFGDRETQGLLAQGLIGEASKIGSLGTELRETNYGDRIERMALLLGAIAFSMHALNPDSEKPEPNTSGLDMTTCKKKAQDRLIQDNHITVAEFERDLDLLQRMNNGTLDYLLLRDTSEKAWIFHDRTVQAFFAAHWAMKYGSPDDRQLLKTWIIDKEKKRLEGFDEFWEFAAAMPDPLVDAGKWLEVFKPCYALPDELARLPDDELQWRRKMICHSYDRLADRAKVLPGAAETYRLWHGDGLGELRAAFLGAFQPCPPVSEGGPHFLIQDFTVTNRQYEKFDLNHRKKRDKVSSEDDQPVIYVSFWDALSFAKWVALEWKDSGYRIELPTEEQWEFACRAGTETAYSFGDELNGTQANCNGDYPEGKKVKGPYLKRTVAKAEKPEKTNYAANSWGLWHMHGNVWEWCDSRYEPGASARVLRGGSWNDSARSCRSAYRLWSGPGNRYNNCGFRLAAVPRNVGAK